MPYFRIFIVSLVAFCIFITIPTSLLAEEKNVSVQLHNYIQNKNSLNIQVSNPYNISGNSDSLSSGSSYIVKLEQNQLVLYRGSSKIRELGTEFTLTPERYDYSHYTTVEGRKYLGSMTFRVDGQYIRPVNTLPLEDYLKGVVPREMPASWHKEALKAQTVAARTFASHPSRNNRELVDTVSDQVYGGYDWHPNTSEAVDSTKGEILTYNGTPVETFYSSSNGGMTESNANVWSSSPLPYFSVKEDPYDPKNAWSLTLQKTQIDLSSRDLKKPENWWQQVREKDSGKAFVNGVKNHLKGRNAYSGYEIKLTTIESLNLSNSRYDGGRHTDATLRVSFIAKDNKGNFVRDSSNNIRVMTENINQRMNPFRIMMGAGEFRSTLVNVQNRSSDIVISGHGFGHGVGLSQHGANERAKAGQSYQDILAFYYDGSSLEGKTASTPLSVTSLEGDNRFQTSVAISQYGWKNPGEVDTVVVGRGDRTADALTGNVLAKKHNAPLLLSETKRVRKEVIEEIKRLSPSHIYVLGGPNAISENAERELQSIAATTRVAGDTRLETAYEIANEVGSSSNKLILTAGSDSSGVNASPDALTIATVAGTEQIPILYTANRSNVNKEVSRYIENNNIQEVFIIGGPNAISSSIENEVKSLAPTVTRVAGDNRFETAIKIVEQWNLSPEKIFFARGDDYADALSGSPLAAKEGAPILLTRSNQVPDVISTYLRNQSSQINSLYYLGGNHAIHSSAREQIESLVR
ncbi:SpoIID/LytB domain-containing protein [Bacillus sp. FJAT-44742]|uniref:SpoIID/LytB domain-containing protein n=1 Tax=Bacillus sp. FJAT-44742 TaxID=2014005 RepID=UPI000C23F26B|nr:SpoIID/LytB domain-containing protein [Bacillus sp. FJAT-44742]